MQLWSITYYTLHTLLIPATNVSHWPISMYTCNLHEIVLCMPFWNMYASWCRCDRSCHCTGTAMCILEKLWHICTVLFTLSATRSVTILNTMALLLETMSTAAPKFAWNSCTHPPQASGEGNYGVWTCACPHTCPPWYTTSFECWNSAAPVGGMVSIDQLCYIRYTFFQSRQ